MACVADLPVAVRELSLRVARAYAARGHEVYLVGGVVRDLLLGAPAGTDLDFATSATPTESKAALSAAGGKVYALGERFGTIGAVFGPTRVEVTTYRAEAYQPGSRKPSVSFEGGLRDDLARRDFTINAIALDPLRGRLEDPFDGQEDLARGFVRAVGSAEDRFKEDPLRLLRAVRFAGR